MKVRRGSTPLDPVAASLRDAAADNGQIFSTICDAVSWVVGSAGVMLPARRGSDTTYRRGCRRNLLSARTGAADTEGVEQRYRWWRCCWCDEGAYATREAPGHQPWEALPLQRHEGKPRSGSSPPTDCRHHSPKSHRPGWWKSRRWSSGRHHRERRRTKTRKRRKRRSRRRRGERGELLRDLGSRYANPGRPSPTYPEARRDSSSTRAVLKATRGPIEGWSDLNRRVKIPFNREPGTKTERQKPSCGPRRRQSLYQLTSARVTL